MSKGQRPCHRHAYVARSSNLLQGENISCIQRKPLTRTTYFLSTPGLLFSAATFSLPPQQHLPKFYLLSRLRDDPLYRYSNVLHSFYPFLRSNEQFGITSKCAVLYNKADDHWPQWTRGCQLVPHVFFPTSSRYIHLIFTSLLNPIIFKLS